MEYDKAERMRKLVKKAHDHSRTEFKRIEIVNLTSLINEETPKLGLNISATGDITREDASYLRVEIARATDTAQYYQDKIMDVLQGY